MMRINSFLRALVPLQLQELWLRSSSGSLVLKSSPICAHLRPIIIVSSDNCQYSVSCSRSSCQETCHDACSWQVFMSSMVPVLHISTNTSDQRGAGRIIMSPERKTAGNGTIRSSERTHNSITSTVQFHHNGFSRGRLASILIYRSSPRKFSCTAPLVTCKSYSIPKRLVWHTTDLS